MNIFIYLINQCINCYLFIYYVPRRLGIFLVNCMACCNVLDKKLVILMKSNTKLIQLVLLLLDSYCVI